MLQLNSAGVGFGTCGKKDVIKTSTRYATEIALTTTPYRPIDHRAGGSVSGCRSLRISKHDIDIAYDDMSVATLRGTMLLKTMVLPMLIRERSTVITNETIRLLSRIGLLTTVETCKTCRSELNSS
jgi:hypothetical protein